MLKNAKISSKFIFMGIVTILLFALLLAWLYPMISKNMYNEKRSKTREIVEVANGVVSYYAKEVKSGKMTQQAAQKAALAELGSMRYSGDQYFFVINQEPRMLMHPIKPEMNGQLVADEKDPNGKALFVDMATVAKRDGAGFVDYEWPKPGVSKPVPKTTYVQLFPEWGWIIGSGIYLDDVSAELSKILRIIVIATLIIAAIAVLICIYVSRNLNGVVRSIVSESKNLTDAAVNGRLSTRGDPEKIHPEFRGIITGFNDTLDSVIGPLKMAAEYVDCIGKGNIPEKITGEFQGDFNELKNNLNKCIDGMGGLIEANSVLQKMAVNDHSVSITGQYQGIYAEVAKAVNDVSTRVKHIVFTVTNLSNGDLAELEEYRNIGNGAGKRSENDKLVPSMIKLMGNLKALATDANMLSEAAVAGKLATRADASAHNGEFKKIVQGVNDTLDAVIGPLNVSADYVDKISKGEIPPKITEVYNGDFAEIKNNLNQCIETLNGLLEETGKLSSAVSNNRLDMRADTARFKGGYQELVKGVNAILDAMNNSLLPVVDMVTQVGSAANQISTSAQGVAEGTAEQASSLEEISSNLEEMSSMTKRNAENAIQAQSLSKHSNDGAEKGKAAMERMNAAIEDIKNSSDRTAKIVKTIDEIAFQTNLLALNAAVEAARAGEVGKGFAVVAEEVRNLAMRSAEAAKDTAKLIEESVKNADNGVKIADEVDKSLVEIADGAGKVNDLVAEIAAASKEQAQGIEMVNVAIGQMDKVTQANASAAEESASAAEELSAQAAQLTDVVGKFKLIGNSNGGGKGLTDVLSSSDIDTLKSFLSQAKSRQPGAAAHDGDGKHRGDGKKSPKVVIPMDAEDFSRF